jgi:hypothetical protein
MADANGISGDNVTANDGFELRTILINLTSSKESLRFVFIIELLA